MRYEVLPALGLNTYPEWISTSWTPIQGQDMGEPKQIQSSALNIFKRNWKPVLLPMPEYYFCTDRHYFRGPLPDTLKPA